MEKAAGDIMRMLSQTGIEITTGRLVACKTRDGASLVCVSNPDDENEMVTEITIQKKGDLALDPEVNHDIFLLEEDKKSRTFRVLLPKGDALIMLFRQPTKK
jgi:deoxycytidine triphosphate deaminase